MAIGVAEGIAAVGPERVGVGRAAPVAFGVCLGALEGGGLVLGPAGVGLVEGVEVLGGLNSGDELVKP